MARYLIGTALTIKGTVRKNQPRDAFRRLLLQQKIAFTELEMIPEMVWIDGELKNECWDRERRVMTGKGWAQRPEYRKRTHLTLWPVTEFTFDDQGDIS